MKKRIKLRAMTESEFCRTQECKTCPEFFPTLGNQFKTRCMSSIKKMLSGEYGDKPYRNSDGKYILVRADD
jgi:hypothetical protein